MMHVRNVTVLVKLTKTTLAANWWILMCQYQIWKCSCAGLQICVTIWFRILINVSGFYFTELTAIWIRYFQNFRKMYIFPSCEFSVGEKAWIPYFPDNFISSRCGPAVFPNQRSAGAVTLFQPVWRDSLCKSHKGLLLRTNSFSNHYVLWAIRQALQE